MKKLLSIILAILMIVTTVPLAFAAEVGYEIKAGETISIIMPEDSGGNFIYIKVIPEVSGMHTLVSDAGEEGDPFAELYDKDMEFIATDDDGKGYPDFKLEYELAAGEIYYLAVRDVAYGTNREWNIRLCNDTSHMGGTQTCQGYLCEFCDSWYGEASEHDLDDEQTCYGYRCRSCGKYFGEAGEHDLDDNQTCCGYYCYSCDEYVGEADPDAHAWNGTYCDLCEEEHEHIGGTQTCKGYKCDICNGWYGEAGEQHELSTEQTCKGYMCNLCYGYYGEVGEHDLDDEQNCLGYYCYTCYKYFGEADETKHGWDYGYCMYCGEEYPEPENCEHNWRGGRCETCGTICSHKEIENGICPVCNYFLPFAVITGETVTYHGSFPDALDKAQDGSVIKLLKDYSDYNSQRINKAITLDLNGKEWLQPSSGSWDIYADATFTDSVGGGYLDYHLYLHSPVTFSGGSYKHLSIDFETENTLGDYLADCCSCFNSYTDELINVDDIKRISNVTIRLSHDLGTQTCKGYQCKECLEYFGEADPDAHDIIIDEAVAPKCGETGLTQGEYCTRCDYRVEQEVVPALKHSFTKYEVTEEAKCGVEGKKVATCDNDCGETDEQAIEALTHTDADGDYKCDNGCGHEFEKPAPEEPTPDTPDEPGDDACDHLCHKGGIMGFFWKIVKFFSKLFKLNPVCECGVAHY